MLEDYVEKEISLRTSYSIVREVKKNLNQLNLDVEIYIKKNVSSLQGCK